MLHQEAAMLIAQADNNNDNYLMKIPLVLHSLMCSPSSAPTVVLNAQNCIVLHLIVAVSGDQDD